MMLKKKKEHVIHSLYIELVKLQKEIISSNLRCLLYLKEEMQQAKMGQ
jgi:hypothetical protein